MIEADPVPDATASPEKHADFLELSVLRSVKKSASIQEFIQDLRIGNSTEAITDSADNNDWASDDDGVEAIAQSAFDELDERRRNFGEQADDYPFEITSNAVNLKKGGEESLYVFLALLSWFGKDAGPKGMEPEKLFEEVCAKAAERYLGGPSNRVKSFLFGFPRRTQPKGFAEAIDALCKALGEGSAHRNRPLLPDQKDAKLDIVAWVEFWDARQGKLITFGQCATGRRWEEKISELASPDKWCEHWMVDTPTISPIRSFFVPHRIEQIQWSYACRFGGVLFDRCRIASLASKAEEKLKKTWIGWSAHILKSIQGTLP